MGNDPEILGLEQQEKVISSGQMIRNDGYQLGHTILYKIIFPVFVRGNKDFSHMRQKRPAPQ